LSSRASTSPTRSHGPPAAGPLAGELSRGQQPQAGAAQEHVADAARLLAARRERDLGEQVGQARDDRLGQLAALGRQREHLVGGVP
jgi:hypothetical protein